MNTAAAKVNSETHLQHFQVGEADKHLVVYFSKPVPRQVPVKDENDKSKYLTKCYIDIGCKKRLNYIISKNVR